MTMHWYVVQTKPHGEARALENLARQGYEPYLPRILKRRRHARRVDMVKRPLFPRYLFVHMDTARQRWYPILSTFGVTSIIRNGVDPAPVPDGVVEAIRQHEEAGTLVEKPAVLNLSPGAPVEVREGPFADLCGEFLRLSDKERVVVLLDLLGRKVRATVSAHAVAPVK